MLFDHSGNRKYLTAEERRAFIAATKRAAPEVETFCLTLAYTGARISEVLALTPSRIDVSAGVIIFETLKRRRKGIYRAVPVPSELIRRIQSVHSLNHSTSTTLSPQPRLWPWGRTSAWYRVKEVMRAAAIPPPRAMPKSLRHAFGVGGVAEARVPLNIMQKWLGHARIETTAIYANATGAEERCIAARIWGTLNNEM